MECCCRPTYTISPTENTNKHEKWWGTSHQHSADGLHPSTVEPRRIVMFPCRQRILGFSDSRYVLYCTGVDDERGTSISDADGHRIGQRHKSRDCATRRRGRFALNVFLGTPGERKREKARQTRQTRRQDIIGAVDK